MIYYICLFSCVARIFITPPSFSTLWPHVRDDEHPVNIDALHSWWVRTFLGILIFCYNLWHCKWHNSPFSATKISLWKRLQEMFFPFSLFVGYKMHNSSILQTTNWLTDVKILEEDKSSYVCWEQNGTLNMTIEVVIEEIFVKHYLILNSETLLVKKKSGYTLHWMKLFRRHLFASMKHHDINDDNNSGDNELIRLST